MNSNLYNIDSILFQFYGFVMLVSVEFIQYNFHRELLLKYT